MIEKHLNSKIITSLLYIIISVFMIIELFLNLTPPISRDALIHHLAVPKLWLINGGYYEMPWASFSYYPMNIDLLYLIPLYFKNDIVPKFIHFAFGFGTGLLVYRYLGKRFGRNWGLLGFLIFFSTPVVIRLSTSAYVDLGMVFFTTASIMAWIKWRDENYTGAKWLILSAVCMGLAAGSKYNALIAWFFVNLMVVFYYSRDMKKEMPAVGYGVIFFVITLLAVSPWFIKNILQTGNPIYPLMDNVFRLLHHTGETNVSVAGLAEGSWTSSIFQRRGVMFGEGFWETLFIPLRIFFQGKEMSPQYFDGVLNPILVIMVPFAFLKKDQNRDKLFFLLFSVFFLLMACFLTIIRIRYILPIIPFLTILSVMGIRTIVQWTTDRFSGPVHRIGMITIASVTIILVTVNIFYLIAYFNTVQPMKYVFHQETRDEFLARNIGSYPAVKYINENLPEDSRVFLMFLGRRGYYLDRPYYYDSSFGMKTINSMISASKDRRDFQAYIQSSEATHVLMRIRLFNKYLRDNFSKEDVARFIGLAKKYWRPVYVSNGYAVMEVRK